MILLDIFTAFLVMLLLFYFLRFCDLNVLQFFPTAEESMDYYNQKRCVDGKGLVLPSQIVSSTLQCVG
jgi:hypothetical protein